MHINRILKTTIIITHNQDGVEEWYNDFSSLLPEASIWELPALDVMSVSATAKSLELKAKRMKIWECSLEKSLSLF